MSHVTTVGLCDFFSAAVMGRHLTATRILDTPMLLPLLEDEDTDADADAAVAAEAIPALMLAPDVDRLAVPPGEVVAGNVRSVTAGDLDLILGAGDLERNTDIMNVCPVIDQQEVDKRILYEYRILRSVQQ